MQWPEERTKNAWLKAVYYFIVLGNERGVKVKIFNSGKERIQKWVLSVDAKA